jgi:hypothetical protein
LPHEIEPNHYCRRSVIGAPDFDAKKLINAAYASTVQDPNVKQFVDGPLVSDDTRR